MLKEDKCNATIENLEYVAPPVNDAFAAEISGRGDPGYDSDYSAVCNLCSSPLFLPQQLPQEIFRSCAGRRPGNRRRATERRRRLALNRWTGVVGPAGAP